MTYVEAVEFLYGLRTFGTKLGLENTFTLAELAGNPQQNLRFIHVAGTNGKGSTCAMLESIYRTAGLRVGLFTSPHLVSFAERIQVNRELISEGAVARLVDEMRPLLGTFTPDAHPTFFEVVAVMALKYFAENKCDLVIWETGMGGRLDATNIVTPLACVITNIGLDHQQWLGETIEQIAFEKAGIIKPNVPVITASADVRALEVIAKTAKDRSAPLIHVTERETRSGLLAEVTLPLLGKHQRLNAAAAIAAVNRLQATITISDAAIKRGLQTVQWAGRLQLIQRSSGQSVLLDGAHNPDGIRVLQETLQQEFSGQKIALVLGILQDKDTAGICEALAPLAATIALVPVKSPRTATPASLLELCRKSNPAAQYVECSSVSDALEKLANESLVLITGSLYLVGEALQALDTTNARRDESKLNEWSGVPGTHPR